MKTIVLDCSSYESALHSLSVSIQKTPEEIIKRIANIDTYGISKNDIEQPFEDSLFDEFMEGIDSIPFEQINWFHFTRTFPENSYSQGLLHRSKAESTIWECILKAIASIDKSISENLEHCIHTYVGLYNEGPCGMLVRENGFHSTEAHIHNYLQEPEFIQDACLQYSKLYKQDIMPLISRLLVPCIVTFRAKLSDLDNDDYINNVLQYIYYRRRREFINLYCYNGRGKAIPPQDIISIDFNPIE
ncbi:hypothetical protein SpiGrapes_1251 [Sphaerochaeta pleomorpha str. Grapes]|uniref:Uncharacterized protein n=1 Tax=Sphaerochaeta pleomorpha (strain ATCC BAA-1885 / DSM 22778 / Grapes) TaxID=158190 RepID=G8QT98_SPHPG|nr:hypothetical protein [Sphaerochaeta pleomorpha]AEV29065.1 hypothetical protein SpiGrapes_1251 [Sphaerochaeta pleomorpha str. Grapes]